MTDCLRIHTHFFVCTNERPENHPLPSCAPRGGMSVFAALTQELARRGFPSGVKVTATGCLTPCQYGPNVVVYPEGIWYAGVTTSDVREIVETHLSEAGTVERLRLPEEVQVT